MKIDGTLIIFIVLIAALVGGAFMLGNVDPITPAVTQGKMQLTVGHTAAEWINSIAGWFLKLAVGGVCGGFGLALFNEAHKAYRLWKRNAQAGRWQPGPNANWQARQPSAPKLSKQDMLLLALSGRLPADGRPSLNMTSTAGDEDQLDIRL
jgi:hypothetical protein